MTERYLHLNATTFGLLRMRVARTDRLIDTTDLHTPERISFLKLSSIYSFQVRVEAFGARLLNEKASFFAVILKKLRWCL